MAHIQIDRIIDHLSYELRAALEEAVRTAIPHIRPDVGELFDEFRRQAWLNCSEWAAVPETCVRGAGHGDGLRASE